MTAPHGDPTGAPRVGVARERQRQRGLPEFRRTRRSPPEGRASRTPLREGKTQPWRLKKSTTSHIDSDLGLPGEQAGKPTEIPRQGWLQVVRRGWAEAKADQVPLLGAGVAFFGFLAIFPAVIALVTLYGLFADPATIADQVNSLNALPAEVRQLIVDQINNQSRAALGWSVILSIALALFSASGGSTT